ncbi:MAG: hypothetical protein U9N81_05500 [Bacillota bacterium]|nr:hypothetical protein [Bacillota bacterium]
MRKTIAGIPDGDYSFQDYLDGDGFSSTDLCISLRLL